MTKQRRHFAGTEKVAILKRHLLDQVPISDLCDELGEDGVLSLELGFEPLYLEVVGVLDGLALAAVVESGVTVLEKLFEPAVNLVGVEAEFIAQVRDGDLVEEMAFKDGDLLGAGEVTTLLGHDEPPFRLC